MGDRAARGTIIECLLPSDAIATPALHTASILFTAYSFPAVDGAAS